MKTLFLDHDGVMVTDGDFACDENNLFDRMPFSKKCVLIVNEIIGLTGAEIVVSSDWRNDFSLEEMGQIYEMNGVIKKPIGYTPNSKLYKANELENGRVSEILSWAEYHRIKNWVAIDDLKMFDLSPHFVHCPKHAEGLGLIGIKEKVLEALKIDKIWPKGYRL